MAYFPFFVDLEGRNGLIVGGGTVALRKAEKLLSFGPRLTVAAPDILPALEALPGLTFLRQPFSPEMLEGIAFVIAATDDRALNREIAAQCQARRVPANAVDDQDSCTFLFPALVKQDSLTIGISTGGASPMAAAYLKDQISALLPEDFGALLTELKALRPRVKAALPESERPAAFSRLFHTRLAARRSLTEPEIDMLLSGADMKRGCVYLVGAGCGAADLITVRGARLLANCDTVIYDDLIDPALLDLTPSKAERLYMGKRQSRRSAAQDEICALLIKKARAGQTVVRLKGGDPFVFGRGGEEARALSAASVPWEVVPGITSAIAIPGEAGIPVTHRGVSRSVHIVTAHTAKGSLPPDLNLLAQLEGTLVFLMGLRRLPQLAAALMKAGKVPDTPAAVVSGGNAPHPMIVRGTLADIAEKARDVHPPAVIVVGPTAAMDLMADRPLSGVTVALTGTAAVTDKLFPALEVLGASVFLAERSLVTPFPPPQGLKELADSRHWLVFTSANGVRCFFDDLAELGMDLRCLHACRFAVIGPATAAALEEHGIQADLCPEVHTTAALAQALLDAVPAGETVCLLRSTHGSPDLASVLTEKFQVRDVPLYRLVADSQTAQSATDRRADILVFSSGSGVELYFAAHGAVPEGTVCICIGNVTAAVLRLWYDGPCLTAEDASAEGLVTAIQRAVQLFQKS
ncbi:siroheme synthase CysG [uncultured Dysosmobacter sp.]|uniref:siroheme synthase CysG n=1 Tax=uncultured Dysosmobacter sp. TaxID=2591384 RepID=UPI0026173EC2|nr:siroheme synthase CysG [uncultured Dysosmobacter sp.]